jgi:glutamyl endopeptidase
MIRLTPSRAYGLTSCAPTLSGVLGLALFFGLGLGSIDTARAQSSDALHAPVSDVEGLVLPTIESGATSEPSFVGLGRVLRPGQRDDALAERPGRPETAAEVWALMEHSPKSGPVGVESIIGRDQRRLVSPTTGIPARMNVLITFVQSGRSSRCSGSMIGPDTVATAGHCVHSGGAGGRWSTNVVVYPGRNGSASPYGSCTARNLHSVAGWTREGRDDFDYGAIKLNCNIGRTTGWYGYFTTRGSLVGLRTEIWGYPGDKPLTQWRSRDRVRVSQTTRTFYRNDTVSGMSGSGVWYDRPGCGLCLMAIHAYGVYNGPPFDTNNHGTRITRSVYRNLSTWKRL